VYIQSCKLNLWLTIYCSECRDLIVSIFLQSWNGVGDDRRNRKMPVIKVSPIKNQCVQILFPIEDGSLQGDAHFEWLNSELAAQIAQF
jgi:hypothetical protein